MIISVVLGIFCTSVNAQGPTSHWFMGEYIGLKFENHVPQLYTGFNLTSQAAVASLSDIDGELMYYGRPNLVMNRNHDTLQGASGILGFFGSTQGALFVPHPSNKSITYFIHGNGHNNDTNLHYSIIRTSIANPLGFILPEEKNIPFNLLGLQATSKLTAVHHANGRDVWLITRVYHADSIAAFLITDNGVSENPVLSYSRAPDDFLAFYGQIKASPNGHLLCEGINVLSNGELATHAFHQFNNITGEVGNSVYYHEPNEASRGAEFSANSRYAYFSRIGGGALYLDTNLVRFDLSIFDSSAIANSKIEVGDTNRISHGLQIGIDKRVYAADNLFFTAGRYEAVVDASLPNCSYLTHIFTYVPVVAGMPDFIQSFFRPAYFDYKHACIGDTTEFISQTVDEDSLKWDFGDPSSGILNFSTQKNPTHYFAQDGEYNVTLIVYAEGSSDTFSRLIEISPPLLDLNIVGDTICFSSPIVLNPNPNQNWTNHLWMDSLFQDTFLISDTGTYWVSIWNACDTLFDTLYISDDPGIRLNLSDTTICSPLSFQVSPNLDSATSWNWFDGDTIERSRLVQQDTGIVTVWITATNACGAASDTLNITFIPPPNVDWFTDSILCGKREPLIIPESNIWVKYEFQNPDLDTLNPWLVERQGMYFLTALNVCDTITKSALLSPNQVINKSLISEVELCRGKEYVLDATWPASSYLWSINGVVDSARTDSIYEVKYSPETQLISVLISNDPCKLTLQTLVTPNEVDSCNPCKFSIPNVITPNGDRVNDVLKIANTCFDQFFTFSIYNRWGVLIYESNQSLPYWDGTINGSFANEGTYFIVVEFVDDFGETSSIRNSFMLLK